MSQNVNPGKIKIKSGKRIHKKGKPSIKKDVAKLKKKVKLLAMEQQDHIHDTSFLGQVSSLSGTYNLLNGIAQGDNFNNREGNEIVMKYLSLKFQMVRNAANTVSANYLRVAVIIDRQTNGSAPTTADVLEVDTIPLLSSRGWNQRKRFKFLYDKVFLLTTVDPALFVNIRIPLKMLKTQYDGTGNTLGDISTNPVYLVIWTEQTANQPLYSAYNRILFSA